MCLRRATACEWVILKYRYSMRLRVALMRSKRSFLGRVLRYLRQFITHSHSGQRSSTARYCRMSSPSRQRLSYISSHMKYRLILSQQRSLSSPRSAVRNWNSTSGVAVCSQYSHSKLQKLQSQLRPSFSRMKLRRFTVSQLRKSIDSTSSRRISRSANTTRAPRTWMQVQLARHSCRKAYSFSQMPSTSVRLADTFSMVFSSSRQRRQMVWISLISMASLELLRSKLSGCPCSRYWQGSPSNFSQNSSSQRAYVSICFVSAVYSSPNFSCSDFLQISGLWTRTSSNCAIFCSALKQTSFLEQRLSSSLPETYSPKTGAGDWKMSIQSQMPHSLAMNLEYFSCASSASPADPIIEIAEITRGTSFVSSSSRQFSLRYSPLIYVRSSVIEISAQRSAEAKSRSSNRHCEEFAYSTALSRFLSQSNSSPRPISQISSAYSKLRSLNFSLASFLMASGWRFEMLQLRLTSMPSGRVRMNCSVVQNLCSPLKGLRTRREVRKEFSWLHFRAASLLGKTMTRMALRSELLGLSSSRTRQTSAWLNCRMRRIWTLRHCLLLLPMNRSSMPISRQSSSGCSAGGAFWRLNSRKRAWPLAMDSYWQAFLKRTDPKYCLTMGIRSRWESSGLVFYKCMVNSIEIIILALQFYYGPPAVRNDALPRGRASPLLQPHLRLHQRRLHARHARPLHLPHPPEQLQLLLRQARLARQPPPGSQDPPPQKHLAAVKHRHQLPQVAQPLHLRQGGLREAAEGLQHHLRPAKGVRGHHQGLPQIPPRKRRPQLLQKTANRKGDLEQAQHKQASPAAARQSREKREESGPGKISEQRGRSGRYHVIHHFPFRQIIATEVTKQLPLCF